MLRESSEGEIRNCATSTSSTQHIGTIWALVHPIKLATRFTTEPLIMHREWRQLLRWPRHSPGFRRLNGREDQAFSCFPPPKSKDCSDRNGMQNIHWCRLRRPLQTSISIP